MMTMARARVTLADCNPSRSPGYGIDILHSDATLTST